MLFSSVILNYFFVAGYHACLQRFYYKISSLHFEKLSFDFFNGYQTSPTSSEVAQPHVESLNESMNHYRNGKLNKSRKVP